MSRILKRICSQRGESLTEVLVAIVVGALAILLLAGAVNVAANINRESRDAMNAYYQANNALVAEGGDGVVTGKGNVIKIVDTSDSHMTWTSGGDLNVKYAIDDKTSDSPIVSYEYVDETAGSGGA